LLGALLTRLALVATAAGAPHASLRAGLAPDRPGAATDLAFSFEISVARGELPPPLTGLRVGLPRGLKIDMAGVAGCTVARVEDGRGCSPDAQVGQGSVKAIVPLGEAIRTERARLTVYKGPRVHGDQTLIFDAVGKVPIATRLVFAAAIRGEGSRGTSIKASIPLEPTLPNSPDVAIVSLSSTLGTLGRAYYTTQGNTRVGFTPKGITLPPSCPGGALGFTAAFGFQDGGTATASARAACVP
jgi:hypothetical protein